MRWRDLPALARREDLLPQSTAAVVVGGDERLQDLTSAGWVCADRAVDGSAHYSHAGLREAVARAVREGWPSAVSEMVRPDRHGTSELRSGGVDWGRERGITLIWTMKNRPTCQVVIEPLVVDRATAVAACGMASLLDDLERAGWLRRIVDRSRCVAYLCAELRSAVERAAREGWPGKGGRPGTSDKGAG